VVPGAVTVFGIFNVANDDQITFLDQEGFLSPGNFRK